MTRLKPSDLEILAAINLNAEVSAVAVARRLSIRADTVRRAVERFLSMGMIKRGPLIDVHRFGVMHYGFFFTPSNVIPSATLSERLCASGEISALSEFAGEYRFLASVIASSPLQAAETFQRIISSARIELSKKSLSIRLSLLDLPRGYLSKRPYSAVALTSSGESRINLSETETKVLLELDSPFTSYRELSRSLNVSHSSLDAILRRLKTQGVLKGMVYNINSRAIGRTPYKILISTRGIPAHFEKKLLAHPRVQQNAFHFVRSLGEWDYEINVDTDTPSEISEICDELLTSFSNEISDLTCLTLLMVYKRTSLPGPFVFTKPE